MSSQTRLIGLLVLAAILGVVAAAKHGRAWFVSPRGDGAAAMAMPDLDEGPGRALVRTIQGFRRQPPDGQRLREFRENWPTGRVHPLLEHDEPIVRRCAAIALMQVGDRSSVDPLIARLRDEHPGVRSAAESAVWRVWHNLGSDQSNRLIAKAKKHASQEDYNEAIMLMDKAIEHEPGFAEAYNQRAVLYFQMGKFAESAEDCRRTLERMPRHFGALSGLGQCLMNLGRNAEALNALRRAQRVNPNLNVEGAIRQLKKKLEQGGGKGQAV